MNIRIRLITRNRFWFLFLLFWFLTCPTLSSHLDLAVMSDDFEFADKGNKIIYETEAKGFNPGLIVLLVVGGLLLTFLVGNYVLYSYAQKTLPPRKRKPISKKKMKKERLKQGVSAPGE